MFILNSSTQNLTKLYSSLVRRVLVKVLNLKIIRSNLCFDIYESPRIKDVKRKDRGGIAIEREFCANSTKDPEVPKLSNNTNSKLELSSITNIKKIRS